MSKRMSVTLVSNDDKQFQVDRDVALLFRTVKDLLEDVDSEFAIPLPEVNSANLEKILQYAQMDVKNESENWNLVMDHSPLFELILAVNYLNYSKLLDASCKAVADQIKGKSVEEIRKIFNVENDFTPEEEETFRKENDWIEEK